MIPILTWDMLSSWASGGTSRGLDHQCSRYPGQVRCLLRNSAIRVLTSRFTRAAGGAFAKGNRTVPVDISYPLRAAACARRIAAVIGYRLPWVLEAACHTSGWRAGLETRDP